MEARALQEPHTCPTHTLTCCQLPAAGTFERDNRTVFVVYEGAGTYDLPKVGARLGACC